MNEQLSKKMEYELRHEEKIKEQENTARKRSLKKTIKLFSILFLIAGVIGGLVWYIVAHPPTPKTNRQVALSCTTDMATQFHIHPHLEIIINGTQQEIPANIGISFSCMHPLHTHDTTGTLHVESPTKRDFTLGDFFAVWKKPFNRDQITQETVNGKETEDFENIVLHDRDQIVITYGK